MPDLPRLAERVRRVALGQPATLGDGDCESLRDGCVGQPTNTMTSLAYVTAGGWLSTRVSRLPAGSQRSALAYAALTAVTGVGSVAYHGPQFAGAQSLHDLPIVGVVGAGVVVPLWRRAHGRTALPGWSRPLGTAMAATATLSGAAYVVGRTPSPLCRPDSRLQFHGLWHMGTAAVIAMWGAAVWAPERPEAPDHEPTGADQPPAMPARIGATGV